MNILLIGYCFLYIENVKDIIRLFDNPFILPKLALISNKHNIHLMLWMYTLLIIKQLK